MALKVDAKVAAGGVAGATATLLVWLWNMFMPDRPLTAEEAAAVAVVIAFIAGYAKRNREHM